MYSFLNELNYFQLTLELASCNKRWQMANRTMWETRLASKAIAIQQDQLARHGNGSKKTSVAARVENSACLTDDSGALGSAESSGDEVSFCVFVFYCSISNAK